MASDNVTIQLTDWNGPEIEAAISEAAHSAEDDAGKYMADLAEAGAPKHTGYGASKIKAVRTGDGVTVTTGHSFTWWSEFGSRTHRPQPFMRPAMTATEPVFNELARQKLSEAIKG